MPFEWNGPIAIGKKLGPVGIIITILEFLASLLGFSSDHTKVLQQAINTTYANLLMSTAFLYNAIGHLSEFFQKLIGILFGGLKHIISDILHGHLKKVLEDIQALMHALHNLFAPLIAWLRKLQAIQRQYQLQTLRRLVNLIQRARQILVVFRLLHLKFAQKLDNWLAGIEGKIITREIDIARKTNEILGWVDFITDPFGALRGTAVFGPIGRLLRALAAAARAVDIKRVFPQLSTQPGPNGSTVPWQHYQDAYARDVPATAGNYGAFHGGVLYVRALLDREYKT